MESSSELSEACRHQATEHGFDVCGFAPIAVDLRKDYYEQWIADDKHGDMEWMARNNQRRLDPSQLLPEAKSIVSLGMNYYQEVPDSRARIARYALGKDYHQILYKKLKKICRWMREQGGEQKPYVDTGPVLEKPIAQHAGLGWMGKNTVLISKEHGPYLFLATIITTLEFDLDTETKDYCGHCTKCIDVCPTSAITAPYQLDARKCIAYLTIEHKGPIPIEYREAIGNRIFGCDDCIDICPWVHWAHVTREARFESIKLPDIRDTLAWNDEDFAQHFKGTPVARLKLPRWKRNACVVLGNIGSDEDLPALEALIASSDALVAEHASWAVDAIRKRVSTL